jgi:hypothetical protein
MRIPFTPAQKDLVNKHIARIIDGKRAEETLTDILKVFAEIHDLKDNFLLLSDYSGFEAPDPPKTEEIC